MYIAPTSVIQSIDRKAVKSLEKTAKQVIRMQLGNYRKMMNKVMKILT